MRLSSFRGLNAGMVALCITACAEPAPNISPSKAAEISTQATQNVNQILTLYAALAEEDTAQFLSVFSEDASFILPFNVNGDASAKGIRQGSPGRLVESAFEAYDNIRYVNRSWTVSHDGDVIFVESIGDFVNVATGQPYRNRYVTKYEFEDGKIRRLTEYTNPVTQAQNGKTHLSQPQPSPHQ